MFFFPLEHFLIVPGTKMSLKHNSVRKNLFLSAYFCWGCGNFLHEMDQKVKFGGNIGYGNSYSEFLFRHFEVLRLHAKPHDATVTVRAHSG